MDFLCTLREKDRENRRSKLNWSILHNSNSSDPDEPVFPENLLNFTTAQIRRQPIFQERKVSSDKI